MTEATSNYIAAWMDYKQDRVVVVERDIETRERFTTLVKPPYYFYVPDEDGEYESIFGDKLARVDADSKEEFDYLSRACPVKFESDIRPLARVLMDMYYGRPTPPVNFVFFDIEVDYKQSIGFAGPSNPYAPINANTIYSSWTNEYITLAVPPPGYVIDETFMDKIHENWKQQKMGFEPNIIICRDELELLERTLDLIQDADIISGWNSEFYDVPYVCERIKLLMGEKALSSLELPGCRPPRKEMMNHFGNEEPVYKFQGRSHLDYRQLFEKFTFEGRTSYALANIANEELDVPKLDYDGTLEELYLNDFIHFITYNARDVEVLVKLDQKFKFIALVNQMAHENTVDFAAILGTVKYVETGITNHAHRVLNKIVHDKVIGQNNKVEGAVVLSPKVGMHDLPASVDIKSLYPNVIRSINISPEKIIGQFTNTEDEADWEAINRGDHAVRCTLILEDGTQHVKTAAEWKQILIDNKWAVSGYGTVFDQGNGRGVVADILGFWYTERIRLQAEKKKYSKLADKEEDPVKKAEYEKLAEQFDLLQLTKKISMNSLYGALLNVAFRFGDERMGASVTASGRRITKHMLETLNFYLTGEQVPLKKQRIIDDKGDLQILYTIDSDAIIYSDTDSGYFKCVGAEDNDTAVAIADEVAKLVNDSFPDLMRNGFLCQPGFDTHIQAAREVVGVRGLFQAKKKYMIKCFDIEGKRVDKMKSQGSEIKKADTPKIIQKFLKETVDMILNGEDLDTVSDYVNSQRRIVLKNPDNVFLLGVAKQINNLEQYTAEYFVWQKNGGIGKKPRVPGHAMAAMNYNMLLDEFDKGAKSIRSGDKGLVYYLKPNNYGMKSIALPAELLRFPKWFVENFSVDIKKTEQKMFDAKLGGVFAALGHEVPTPQGVHVKRLLEF
jgi:DNA polymerase elongation subunit (family B)